MGEETTRLEDEIRRERAGLADSIQALEDKAHRAGNWRYQFAKRPAAGLGIAFVGGLALARLVTNGNSDSAADSPDREIPSRDRETQRQSRRARHSGLLAGLQGALAGVISQELKSYRRNRVLTTTDSGTPAVPVEPAARTSAATASPDT